jgi:hypothetical protein
MAEERPESTIYLLDLTSFVRSETRFDHMCLISSNGTLDADVANTGIFYVIIVFLVQFWSAGLET